MDTINLRNYPLDTVQGWLHSGVISEDQWEGYAHAWRTGAPRFSNEMAAYESHDFTTDGARAVAEELGCCKWSSEADDVPRDMPRLSALMAEDSIFGGAK